MIHGLPAESSAAATYAAKAGTRAGQDAQHTGDGQPGTASVPEDGAKGFPRRLPPPGPLDAKARAKEERGGARTGGESAGKSNGQGLTEAEQAVLEQLEDRDREVRAHEQAHLAAGASYIARGVHYTYEQGPDGVRYAVAGDVQIDFSPVPGDPEATIEKAQAVYKAALAPAQPSAQDRRVAAQAMQMKMQARAEKLQMETREKPGAGEPGGELSAGQETVPPDSAAGARARVDVRA